METTAITTAASKKSGAPKRRHLPRPWRRRDGTRSPVRMLAMVVGLVVATLAGLAAGALAAGPPSGTLRYTWSIGDRYGMDADGDGIIDNHDGIKDVAKDKAYIQNPTYTLTFDSCASPAVTERSSVITGYVLTLSGAESKTVNGSNCKIQAQVSKLGTFQAKVEIKVGPVTVDERTETIAPKDHLIVSVGDSVASGEGNPDTVEGATLWTPKWQNEQCHRTSLAGPAQAALRMEKRDPHTAVTFVHLACSGASITEGLVGQYEGIAPSKGTMLKPQLDAMKELVGTRKVDALTVSIGANDAQFSNPVKACLAMAKCYEDQVPGVKNAKQMFDEKAPLINEHYPLLDARLDKMAKQEATDAKLAGKVFITQYMDVTKDDDGTYCTGLTQKEKDAGKLPGETTNVDGLSKDEMEWADGYVQDGLNTRVKQSIDLANANGGSQWVWVDGIKPLFGKHGYCAQDRWIRTLFESGLYQRGPDGAFHPNAEGHLYAYANKLEDAMVPVLGIGGTKAPLEFDEVGPLGDSLGTWIQQLDRTGALDKLTNALPFGAREQVQTFLRDKFFGKFLPWVQNKIVEGNDSITELSEKLDDLDGDGNPGVDVGGVANIDLDMTGDIQPKIPTSKKFDITFTVKGSIALDPDLALKAGEVGLTGQKADGKAEFSQTVKLHVDFTKPMGNPARVKIMGDGLSGNIKLNLAGDFGGTDGAANGPDKPAITFTYGGLGLKAVGPASLNLNLAYGVKDPNGDGFIDATEISKPLDFVTGRCVSGAVNVDLKASASLYGFTSKLGSVKMADQDLCDGFEPPVVDLSSFGEFQGITMVELVNGLAQLSQSLRTIQQSADVDIPFVKEGLAEVISANDKLVKFFTDNGLTDPANPMANITFDPTKRPDLDTIDELLPKLAQSLGVPMDKLNPRVVDGRLVLDLGMSYAPGAKNTGTLDFGDQLTRTGLAEVTGTTKATITPSMAVNLGLGVDLRKDTAFGDRFFLQLDGTKPELTADAKVTADAQLKAKLSLLGVDLADDNAAGAVTLLDRKDASKSMLSIDLDGKGDDRLTLNELSNPSTTAQSPIKPTLNAKVPTFGLVATAKLGGAPFATGKVTIGWNDLTKLTGTDALQVTVDGDFTKTLLPFAYDPNNPRATITNLLTATHSGVANLRKLLTTNPELVKALPLSGKRAADIDPMLAKLEGKLAELIELDEELTLEEVEARIEKTIGEALEVANDKWGSIVTLGYTPQTDTVNAALTASIDLGLCTTDRASLPGCTKSMPIGSAPLNFALGSSEDSLAAVSSSGAVKISYDARLKLALGVELPRVTAGTTAGSTPSVSGTPKLFVLDTSSFDLGVGAKVNGTFQAVLGPVEASIGTASTPATASIAARFGLKSATADPAAPKRMYVGSTFETWVSSLAPKQPVAVHDTTSTKSTCSPAADACATLPVTVNGAYLGDLGFRAPDILTPSGWTFDTATVVANLKSETVQYALLVGGIRSFTERLEATLRKMPAGTRIPLLGVDPTAGANVLADFRTGVLDPAQDLVNEVTAANQAQVVRSKVQDFFFEKLGPTSDLKLLRDGTDAGSDVTKGDIDVLLKCKSGTSVADCAATDAATKIEDVQIKLPLGKTAEATSKPLDSGFPGLRISSDSGFSAGVGFQMDLAFGIDRTNGFYIPANAFGSQPELRVEATASLANKIDAQIAFIPASLSDLTPGQPDVAATIGVDLKGGGSDGKITMSQLGSVEITPTVSACANVQIGLVTGGDKKFPSFKADLKMNGGLNCAAGGVTGAPATNSGFGINFDNVRVNAGSVVNEFIAPAAKTIRKYTGPLEGTVDALRKPIPGIAEAARQAGKTAPTWMDLLEAINKIRMAAGEPDQLATVKKVMTVIDLARALDTSTGSVGDIQLGSFGVNVAKASQDSSAASIDGLLQSVSEAGGSTPIMQRLKAAGIKAELADKLQPTAPYQSLTFPAFERPQRLFELLLGKDVPLVRFEAGGSFLHVPIGPYAFPVGPATVYFGGALDLSGHFAAGFDTYGIRQAYSKLTSENPEDRKFAAVAAGMLGGFYLDDYDASGKDVPEILAQAEVVVGAGVGIPGFGVFAEGGVHADAAIDLKTTDGKMRPQQVIAQLRKNPNPVCLFDASAKIEAFVRVNVSTPIKDIHFPIADVTILDEPDLTDFCNTQQEEDSEPLTGKLHLDGTLEVYTSADSDRITVTQTSVAGTVRVTSALGDETFEGVSKVFVDGAAGDDNITVTSVLPSPGSIAAHLCGGPGKDSLTGEAGPSKIYGDNGATLTVPSGTLTCATGPAAADTLTGGPENDLLIGGDGNDALLGRDGDDDLRGEGGDDALLPGAGNDNADAGVGNDTVSYSDRTVPMTVDLRVGKTSGATGTTEKDTFASAETVAGGAADDVLWASSSGSQLDGGYGNDTLNGGNGSDLLIGGDGADDLLGGDGADLLVGVGGNDRMVGGDGPDIYQGGDATDTADYSPEAGPVFVALNGQADDGPVAAEVKDNVLDTEIVIGSSADDELRAGSIPATLYGRGGDDLIVGPGSLNGEGGKDVLQGSSLGDQLSGGDDADLMSDGAGDDTVNGGNGDDVVKAGTGADTYTGGAGKDTVDYSARTNTVTVRLEDGAQDGEGDIYRNIGPDCNGSKCDLVVNDNEVIVGGSGDDILAGTSGDQTLIGNAGNDHFNGRGGTDRFEGGDGNDDARDDDFAVSKPDPAGTGETYIMGAGNDYAGGQLTGKETVDLGDGDDKVALTGDGEVVIEMGAGNDVANTEDGKHTFVGGDGNDSVDSYDGPKDIDLGDGVDVVILRGTGHATRALMGPGKDEFDGSNNPGGPDVVDGGPGDDFLIGSMGNDTLTDPSGSNLIYAGEGNDTITTGPGTDQVIGDKGDDVIVDHGNDAKPRSGWVPNQYLEGNDGNDKVTLVGATHPSTYDNLFGGAGNDVLTSNAGHQELLGDSGDDTLAAGDGNDRVVGGPDNDTLKGEAGDDRLESTSGNDILIGGTGADSIAGGPGVDTVSYADRNAPVAVSMGSNMAYGWNDGNASDDSAMGVPGKRDSLSSSVDHVIGTPFDDTFSMNDINSGEVAWVEGLGGNDTMLNASPPDVAKFQGGDGNDTLIGSTGADTLEGGNGNDLLAGGAGADVEKGGAGNDRFDQGSAVDGGDAISGDAGTDVVDYSARPSGAIAFSTDGVANDGAPGEADDIAAGTESHKAPGTAANTPTVALTPAKTTALVGETVNMTVKVTGSAGVPTGSIDLVDPNRSKATAALDASGQVVIPFRMEAAGSTKLTATYRGDDRYRSASSAQVTITVTKVATQTTITPLNSPTKVGEQTRVRLTVAGTTGGYKPSGTVQVLEGATVLQSFGIVDGSGDVTINTALTAGSHQLTAKWVGDSHSEASTSAPTTVLVTADGKAPAPTVAIGTTGTVSAANAFGVKATVAPSAGASVPDATVTFTAVGTDPVRDVRELGSVAIAAGQPSTPVAATVNVPAGFPGGAWKVTAVVTAGEPAAHVATGNGTITVARPATTTSVASSLNPAQTDDVVTFTATVVRTGGTGVPTGRVTFLDNGAELASAPLDGTGKAVLTRALTLGTHQIAARYDGSDLLAPSTSPAIAQVVKTPAGTSGIATTTALSRSGNVVTATVTPATGGTPAGQVRFTLDGESGSPVNLVNGKATYTIPTLSAGTHQLVGSYLGTATHAASASAPLPIVVAATPPAAPGTSTVTAASRDAVTISWAAPAGGSSPVTSYVVTVKRDAAGTTVKTVDTGSATTSATITGLTPGKLHRFSVQAKSAAGTGPASALSAHALPPFKSVDAFTDRQYRDFAGRAPSSSELATWRSRISGGSYKPEQLMLEMSNANYSSKIAYTIRIYYAFFQRLPSLAQTDAYANRIRKGESVSSVAQFFAASSSFRQKYGSLTNTNYVKRAYLNTLKRNPNSKELAAGVKYLGKGTTKRGAFMVTLSEGSYFKARMKGLVELTTVIRGGLQRLPNTAERQQWEAKLKDGKATRIQVLAWLLTQPAYDARV